MESEIMIKIKLVIKQNQQWGNIIKGSKLTIKQTDRQTDKQTDRQTDRQKDRKTD